MKHFLTSYSALNIKTKDLAFFLRLIFILIKLCWLINVSTPNNNVQFRDLPPSEPSWSVKWQFKQLQTSEVFTLTFRPIPRFLNFFLTPDCLTPRIERKQLENSNIHRRRKKWKSKRRSASKKLSHTFEEKFSFLIM